MKNYKYILFTAGRGPVECGIALLGIQKKFKDFLNIKNLNYEIVKQQLSHKNQAMDTILFKVELDDISKVADWFGTIQWICKSPIRKYSKRKNWFIKCCEVFMPENLSVDPNDLKIQAYKSSGPGGQHRNKVETAIRIIHRPTGTIVTAADAKSKAQNKKRAIDKMQEKLNQLNHEQQVNAELEEWAAKIEIERGNPTRVFKGLRFVER